MSRGQAGISLRENARGRAWAGHPGMIALVACILLLASAGVRAGLAQSDVAERSPFSAAPYGAQQERRLAWAHVLHLLYKAEKTHRLLAMPASPGKSDEAEVASALQDIRSISRLLDRFSGSECNMKAATDHARNLDASARAIIAGKGKRLSLQAAVNEFRDKAPTIQVKTEKLVDTMIEEGADQDQLAITQRQSWLAERVARHATAIGNGEEDLAVHVDVLGRDLHLMKRVVAGQLNGDKALYISRIRNADSRKLLVELDAIMDGLVKLFHQGLDVYPAEMQVKHDLKQMANHMENIERISECLAGNPS